MKKIIFLLGVITLCSNYLLSEEIANSESEHSIVRAKLGQHRTIHTNDGNFFRGKVIEITDDGNIVLQTEVGLLTIPPEDILEETVKIFRKDGTVFKGKLIGEDDLNVTIESKYGIVSINKGEIEKIDRYFGGKLEKLLQKKIFFTAEEQNTEIFKDPTAFVLPPYTFFITGFSMGYGFTDKFHIFTRITNNLNEDLNLIFRRVLLQKIKGARISNLSLDLHIFSNHNMYKEYIKYYENDQLKLEGSSGLSTIKKMYGRKRDFYWKSSIVYSLRNPLKSGRGNWGFHTGITFDKLLFVKPVIEYNEETFDGGFSDSQFYAYRAFMGMDYDLTRKIKFISVLYYDPGNHYLTFGESISSYLQNSFIPDYSEGERKEFDFDFGITYAANDNLRIGFHFQSPYITLYWKFFDY